MTTYLVTVSREVEVDCEGEALAVEAALQVVKSDSSQITCRSEGGKSDYVATLSEKLLITGLCKK